MPAAVSPSEKTGPRDAWAWAVTLLERWQTDEARVDWLLESLPASLGRGERARTQALLLGTVRHLGRIDAALEPLMRHSPRPWVQAALRVAGFELGEGGGEGHAAKVGHHLVERVRQLASAPEAKFANAVVRKLAAELTGPRTAPTDEASVEAWATHYSHPAWLIERWWLQWGRTHTRRLLELNQTPAPITVRRRSGGNEGNRPDWLIPVATAPEFLTVAPGHGSEIISLLQSGQFSVQDAATRHALDLMAPQPGETLLDLGAAPGGKSLALADRLGHGQVVAVDLPGRRLPRLRENLKQVPPGVEARLVAADVLKGLARALAAENLPLTYAGVLLDAPCSNTGVIRHRVDVKWRLDPGSFRRHARQQLDLLVAAAERVAPGGRLIYSTCSIDRAENEELAQAFVRRSQGAFVLDEAVVSQPWITGHDGAAAFRLRRVTAPA